MSKLTWDEAGKKYYEVGVSNAVLFVMKDDGTYDTGVAWSGVINVTESPDGAEPNDLYADNIKYASIRSAENYGASIEAYMHPDEWSACDGSVEQNGVIIGQQPRKGFGLVYITQIGSDASEEAGYKIHIIYNASASTAEKSHDTINDSPDAMTMSWDISTTPVPVTGRKPTAHLEISSLKADETKLEVFKKTLFGDTSTNSTLPSPDEVLAAFATA